MGKLLAVAVIVGAGVFFFTATQKGSQQPVSQPQQAVDTINRATEKLDQAQQTEQQRADQIQNQDP